MINCKNMKCFISSPDLREELRPETLQDVSEVTKFDTSKLKHVETKESNVLPSKEGLYPTLQAILGLHIRGVGGRETEEGMGTRDQEKKVILENF